MARAVASEPKIGSYQDLRVWQMAMDLVVESYRLARLLPSSERFGLVSQITRSAVSVPANIAEATGVCCVESISTTCRSLVGR